MQIQQLAASDAIAEVAEKLHTLAKHVLNRSAMRYAFPRRRISYLHLACFSFISFNSLCPFDRWRLAINCDSAGEAASITALESFLSSISTQSHSPAPPLAFAKCVRAARERERERECVCVCVYLFISMYVHVRLCLHIYMYLCVFTYKKVRFIDRIPQPARFPSIILNHVDILSQLCLLPPLSDTHTTRSWPATLQSIFQPGACLGNPTLIVIAVCSRSWLTLWPTSFSIVKFGEMEGREVK